VPIESAVLFELIHILLLPNLAFDSLFRCFLSESVNLLFGPRFELDSFELDSDMFLSLATLSMRMHNGDGLKRGSLKNTEAQNWYLKDHILESTQPKKQNINGF
jgi:hypothetical protein